MAALLPHTATLTTIDCFGGGTNHQWPLAAGLPAIGDTVVTGSRSYTVTRRIWDLTHTDPDSIAIDQTPIPVVHVGIHAEEPE